MPCSLASLSVSWRGCSLSQEQPLVLYSGCPAELQSQQPCTTSYTGWAIHSESYTSCACLLTSACKARRPSTSLDFVCWLPLCQVVLRAVRLTTASFSCLECSQLHLVPKRSPHLDLMLGTLCRLSCVIHLCLWTVSNVHSRLFCSVLRLGFLVVTAGRLCDDFRSLCVFEMSVYYYYLLNNKIYVHITKNIFIQLYYWVHKES